MTGLSSGVEAPSSRAGRKCREDAEAIRGRNSWRRCSRSSGGIRWGRGSWISRRSAIWKSERGRQKGMLFV